MIGYDDFQKLELRAGEVVAAEKIEKSQKLLKLIVDLGEEKKQVVSGIAESYSPEELIGKQVVIVANLEPRTLMGEDSCGMILAITTDEKIVLLQPNSEVPNGSKVS